MIPAAFGYQRPSSLDEALRLLAADSGAKVLAGGQSLLPLLKLRLGAAETLIDIGRLSELKGYRALPDGGVEIGALTTYAEWRAATQISGIPEAIDQIADVQVRNRGTVGGSIAHADPASDMPAIALVFDASAVLRGPGGERVVPMDQFFQGPFVTDIAPGEVLVAIRRPKVADNAQFAYRKLANKASGYSLVGVASLIAASGGRVTHARVAITGVGDAPYRAKAVEDALAGSDGSAGAIESASAHATDGIEVASDIHADRTYRTAMAAVYTRRAIEAALARLT
jgi:carbon-monoxide dehydrogenase medium subunit